ncbi:hypothetical protein EPUL_003044, partial [Erysiphe pulchra]
MLQASIEYLSAGANRHPSTADWDSSGLLAYGADRNIALWEPDQGKGSRGTIDLLTGHTDIVNAVKFFTAIPGILLSGSVDTTLILWKRDVISKKFVHAQTLVQHTSSINCIAVSSRISNIFTSGSADGTVNIWAFDNDGLASLKQTIEITPKFFPLALALTPLPEVVDSYVLAVAGTKNIIQLYVLDLKQSSDFKLQVTLSSHEGWIRSLDFTKENLNTKGDILLSSASQDKYIRLWRFHFEKDLSQTIISEADQSDKAHVTPSKLLSNKIHRFKAESREFSVTFEALLSGHEDWIYSAKWITSGEKYQLLSASADNSLAIWEPDSSTGVYTITTRMGEISSEKGSTTATGSTGGFWTGLWSPSAKSVACLGRTGSWRLWRWDAEKSRWQQTIGVSGHTRSVNGISWAKNGGYLLSTSSDQTTRLHAKWYRKNRESWHEMARPQIHGYDLFCIDCLGKSQFVSGAEEKLLRVFKQPKASRNLLSRLSGLNIVDDDEDEAPDAANMPLLGLSNKKIEVIRDIGNETDVEDNQEALDLKPDYVKNKLNLDHPPLEDQLSKFTLWPEMEKLYGHGYEISALAVSHDSSIVATACKATTIEHAVIRLYETKQWLEIKPALMAHSLTVAKLAFSDDDTFLLSVGRDRKWTIFRRDENNKHLFSLDESNEPAHLRMILDASWAPTYQFLGEELRVFATSGRDKKTKLWAKNWKKDDSFLCRTTILDEYPVTAVHFLDSPRNDKSQLYLAIGNDIGDVKIYSITANDELLANRLMVQYTCSNLYPSRKITQVAWRPIAAVNQEENKDELKTELELAVASEDCS